MNTLKVELEKDAFVPGETLQGIVRWRSERAPGEARLRLFWHTEGKGTVDAVVCETKQLVLAAPGGEAAFSFVLPFEPFSYDGTLLSIMWKVELNLPQERETIHTTFVLSPTLVPFVGRTT